MSTYTRTAGSKLNFVSPDPTVQQFRIRLTLCSPLFFKTNFNNSKKPKLEISSFFVNLNIFNSGIEFIRIIQITIAVNVYQLPNKHNAHKERFHRLDWKKRGPNSEVIGIGSPT